jgi:hypothetical protein
MKPPNPLRITSYVWWGITAVSALIIFLPWIIGLKGFSSISVIGFCLAILGVFQAVIYMRRARTLDKIFAGEDLLAHWTYHAEDWTKFVREEYQRDKATKGKPFLITSAILLLVGVGGLLFGLLFDNKVGGWVFLLMLLLIGIIGLLWFAAWYNFRQNMRLPGETYITPYAVYLSRRLHVWNSGRLWLKSVDIKADGEPYIEFNYMSPSRWGIQQRNVNVPIPKGKLPEAQDILGKFKTGNN